MDFTEFKSRFQREQVEEYPNEVDPKPLVSILVLTYNHVAFLPQCLDSILGQKVNFKLEILLADDESVDGTQEICLQYAKKYPGLIRFFQHKKINNIQINKLDTGIFNALYSLYQAKGEYIAYCDGDDLWGDKTKIHRQVNFLQQNPDYILSYHPVIYFNDQSSLPIKNKNILNKDLSSEELKKVIQQPLLNTVCFRNNMKNYPAEITTILNSDNFLISLLGHFGKGKYLESIKPSTYRIHSGGIWSMISKEKKFLSKIQSLKTIAHYYGQNNQKELSKYFTTEVYMYQKSLIFINWKNKTYIKMLKNLLDYSIYSIANSPILLDLKPYLSRKMQ
ncbi:hypothetical protein APR41_08140 [Salegentibacter salinarum]|uniref:Glycosyltransferase 2-like domain-containing protein n=1 Tax=Salegentibacter salinarum TaxID=447422 RepID=A0A2N0TPV2_9FLAO|nr:glycosyltransferase [Salegentibacter salinarum]PKD16765.1 hypothetical protein APR41_08140 [Salegentibacter salinarum]SKB59361.1 Glycosyltransferase involved in cell wall bisynthesis [Salegentibacter salinarum]